MASLLLFEPYSSFVVRGATKSGTYFKHTASRHRCQKGRLSYANSTKATPLDGGQDLSPVS